MERFHAELVNGRSECDAFLMGRKLVFTNCERPSPEGDTELHEWRATVLHQQAKTVPSSCEIVMENTDCKSTQRKSYADFQGSPITLF